VVDELQAAHCSDSAVLMKVALGKVIEKLNACGWWMFAGRFLVTLPSLKTGINLWFESPSLILQV